MNMGYGERLTPTRAIRPVSGHPFTFHADSEHRGGTYTIDTWKTAYGEWQADCDCPGFYGHKHCWHADKAIERQRAQEEFDDEIAKGRPERKMTQLQTMERSDESRAATPFIGADPAEMSRRLALVKQQLAVTQQFFAEVMVQGVDYGVIPGTDKPTLLKPGSEKMAELYGYSIQIPAGNVTEVADYDTGFYRARVTVSLRNRANDVIVADGVGEANTKEGRYRWRFVPDFKLPKGMDTTGLHSEVRKAKKTGREFTMYRIENEDPFSLWNTVLKMAKKRAVVDAVLSATRSSGLFTQDVEDLAEWARAGDIIDGETGEIINEKPLTFGQQLAAAVQGVGVKLGDLHHVLGKITKEDVEAKASAWCSENAATPEQLVSRVVDRMTEAKDAQAEPQQAEPAGPA